MTKKTNSEIQAKYRNSRSLVGVTGEQRLNTWISTEAKMALKNIASYSGETQKQTLERLIVQAQEKIVGELSDSEFDVYIKSE